MIKYGLERSMILTIALKEEIPWGFFRLEVLSA